MHWPAFNKSFFNFMHLKILATNFNKLDNEIRLGILAVVIGVVGGGSAVIFREFIILFYTLLIRIPYDSSSLLLPFLLVVMPMLGGTVVGYITSRISPESKGHGIPEIIDVVATKGGNFRMRVPFAKMIASSITLGTGGSAGREGPIAQISGGFGSVLGQLLHLTPEEKKDLIISGVAAGIAATFNTPIGGILFAIEIIRRDHQSSPLLPLILSSVVGTAIGIFFLGSKPSFIFPAYVGYKTPLNIPIFVIIGVIIGLISILWIRGFYFIEDLFNKIPSSPILIAAFGGLLVVIIQLILWSQKLPLIFWVPIGSDIGVDAIGAINQIFAENMGLSAVIILFILGFLLTSITLGSGGSGGIFAPTLFLGVMLGAIIGHTLEMFGLLTFDFALLVVIGMAAMFAGSARAPFTSIIMTAEMVGDFTIIIPLMFAVTASYLTSRTLFEDDIFILKLKRRGVLFSRKVDFFDDILVKEVMTTNVVTISEKDRIENVIDLMAKSGHTGYPVVDIEEKLVGIITEHDIRNALLSGKSPKDWSVGDICTHTVVSILPECPLSSVTSLMASRKINRLPVINDLEKRVVIGWITRSDIIRIYLKIRHSNIHEWHESQLFDSSFVTQLKEKSSDSALK